MRIKRGYKARQRRNKVLKLAKGFRGGRGKLYRTAADAVDKALMYAYRDRRQRKRDFQTSVDCPDQRRRPDERDHLQPLHAWLEKSRCHPGP
jgi:hypothetical protein